MAANLFRREALAHKLKDLQLSLAQAQIFALGTEG